MMKRIVIATVILLLSTQASTLLAQELDKPEEGKAKLYIFYFGMRGITARTAASIFVDDRYHGTVGSSYYMGTDVEPGEHLLWSFAGGQKWFVRLDAAVGKTYYVKLTPMARFGAPSPRMFNACPNNKKGKGRYHKIKAKLADNDFTLASNPPEEIERGQENNAGRIEEVLKLWESEWSNSKKWPVIAAQDGD